MAHKLLLADDSVTIQRVIELTFADEDIQVVAVSDGDQAIARVEADPPDIVLADVGMPGRDGYEVAAHLKRSPRLAHIPVVLLTGAFEPVDQARVDAIGCDGVLAKPFEPQLVIGRVKELLARERRAPTTHSRDIGDYLASLDAALAGVSDGPTAAQSAVLENPGNRGSRPPSPSRAPEPQPLPPPPASEAPAETAKPRGPTLASPPPLADAFTALLAAEQSGSGSTDTPSWSAPVSMPSWSSPAEPAWLPSAPAVTPPPPAPAVIVTEDLIEQATRQVLERLTDHVVRETVAEIVTAVAERLVREEIDRLKASIDNGSGSNP